MFCKIESNSVIGLAERITRGKPGPGAYQPNFAKTCKSGGVFTFRKKLPINFDDKVPGPGSYKPNAETAVKKTPSWRFNVGP